MSGSEDLQARIGVVPESGRPDDSRLGTGILHPTISKRHGTCDTQLGSLRRIRGRRGLQRHADARPTQPSRLRHPATITRQARRQHRGFCHYTVTGSDGTATQTQGGWIVVGNPPATLTQSGNNQSGSAGTALSQPLTVTLSPGQSGGSANGAGILFTTSAGTLSNGATSGTSVIATTNSSGTASVTLTLPSNAGER